LTKAGLLTDRSSQTGCLPISEETVAKLAGPLAVHSGATVRDSHPLPFSPAPEGENLGIVYGYHKPGSEVNVIPPKFY